MLTLSTQLTFPAELALLCDLAMMAVLVAVFAMDLVWPELTRPEVLRAAFNCTNMGRFSGVQRAGTLLKIG